MAGPCTCHNIDRAPTNDNNTLVPIPAVFCTAIPALAQILTPVQAFTPAFDSTLGPPERYTNKNL